MKTQRFARSTADPFFPRAPSLWTLGRVWGAQKNYRENRENGTGQDDPDRPFPSGGFDKLDVKNSVSQGSGKYPDPQGRYWLKLTLQDGSTNNDYYWMEDKQRGFPEKDHKGNDRYWYIIGHGPSNTTIKGFCWQPDCEKGYPDGNNRYWSYVEFNDQHSPAIRQWMMDKDINYLRRLQRENPALYEQELPTAVPEVQAVFAEEQATKEPPVSESKANLSPRSGYSTP